MTNRDQQKTPIRIYQTDHHVVLTTPMPGLEPRDITVKITDNRIVIRGEQRGPNNEWRDLLVSEWNVGPYHREVDLPTAVSGKLSNATFGNGVLVLSMPKLDSAETLDSAEFSLEVIEAPRGERVGHTGHDNRKITTQEHRRMRQLAARPA
jgi:HSP20 family protein